MVDMQGYFLHINKEGYFVPEFIRDDYDGVPSCKKIELFWTKYKTYESLPEFEKFFYYVNKDPDYIDTEGQSEDGLYYRSIYDSYNYHWLKIEDYYPQFE